ncbi:hypothetical protein Lal_00028144 [Lupinus albus]|uniref:Putative isoflavone-7-O-beta-glucoside 6''-O-malonyltransferase n=1 Tax=Lupinus albus TaxID=3870 RepID=A0A6A4NRX0_LUPAL|nr:putative isoflavone-7-O-beta-glucoside 6''-O-malonyltransferase [Lupinus albus]KAF1859960.1 hypothetical protein Lal_00028144 [Lupinus albus]
MEQQQKTIQVIEVYKVQPPQEKPTSLPLTFFDLLWLRFPPTSRLFFYQFPHSTFDSLVPNLKHSLSLTLQHFFHLSGNITWPLHSPNPIINYVPGDAIYFTIANSNSNNFNHLCSNLCEAFQTQPLIPTLNITHEQASVLALQLTLFPNFGFCIGITTHHAALDGKSSTMFMKSWAYTCSKLIQSPSSSLSLPQNLTPFFDRSVIEDPKGIHEIYVKEQLKHGGTNNRSLKVWETKNTKEADAVRGLFELTPLHIQKLKEYAQSKLKRKVQLSTFSVTCAYVLTCLVKAQHIKANSVVFIFSVDCRPRLDPPIVATYIGNCVKGQMVPFEVNGLLENDGFIKSLEGIIEALNRMEEDEVLSGAETWMSRMQDFKDIILLSVAGSPRFEVYSVDFGWGRPKKVDMTSIDKTGAFSLSESRNNNKGIEVSLTLNKPNMETFAHHFAHTLQSFGCFENVE